MTEASPRANANKAVSGVIGDMQLINISEQDSLLLPLSAQCSDASRSGAVFVCSIPFSSSYFATSPIYGAQEV